MRIYDKDKLDNHYNNIIKSNIVRHMEELKLLEPDLYYYPQEDYHVTVMDILKGELGRTIPQNIDEYINIISKCAEEISVFELLFDGVTASDNVTLVKGYHESKII